MELGAVVQPDGRTLFRVWAPERDHVELKIDVASPQYLDMERTADGYWQVLTDRAPAGTRYMFRLDNELERPDPASRFQPRGVHGSSEVVALRNFAWNDRPWRSPLLESMIFYELHVGTFSEEGTFAGVVSRLDELIELGITVIELMPVAQFPGKRNWGYDGVYPFAAHAGYGGPEGLAALVNACHARGLAVCLDVVYNHMGPEGNYLRDFGPYFTRKYNTPWGDAINFDDRGSDAVREFFIQNALQWLRDFHIDALRLDATHAIYDMSAKPFLEELAERVDRFSRVDGRRRDLIAESDANDPRLIAPRALGGFGLAAQWCDDFHHCVHTLLTGEREGYYADFGQLVQLATSLRQAYVYTGQHAGFRGRRHGKPHPNLHPRQFVVCIQNHDQVGNRMLGERLSALVDFERLKLGAAVLLTSPFLPLLFMGEEYGEEHPFQYFVSHGDPDLVEAVRNGRAEEFKSFRWHGEVPDPQAEETFLRSKLNRATATEGWRRKLREFYKELIAMRKASLGTEASPTRTFEFPQSYCLAMLRDTGAICHVALMNFAAQPTALPLLFLDGGCRKMISSADTRWGGPGGPPERIEAGATVELPPHSFSCYLRA